MSIKILIVDPIHHSALEKLSKRYNVINKIHPDRTKLIKLISNADVLILRSGVRLDENIIDNAEKLKLIARAGTGLDNIPVEYCKNKKIKVFNIPNTSYLSVAEFTFGMMISLMRKINKADAQLRNNVWKKPQLYGNSLNGKTLGIVGLGKIGSCVAKIAKGFNLNILATANKNNNERKKVLASQDIKLLSLEELLKKSDIVSLHVPLSETTKNLISLDQLEIMKPSSYLINLSRGEVVNEEDLILCLKNQVIAGYATDVYKIEKKKSELFNLDNSVFTPHIGAMTHEAQKEIGRILVEKIDQFYSYE
tara:strand:- start:150 stop:1073 length:924 start_codon:yes stop_codon:yes gene_type:complete